MDKLQDISQKHEEINVKKTSTLAELSAKNIELKNLIDSKRVELEPLVTGFNALKEKHHQTEEKYKGMKRNYEKTSA